MSEVWFALPSGVTPPTLFTSPPQYTQTEEIMMRGTGFIFSLQGFLLTWIPLRKSRFSHFHRFRVPTLGRREPSVWNPLGQAHHSPPDPPLLLFTAGGGGPWHFCSLIPAAAFSLCPFFPKPCRSRSQQLSHALLHRRNSYSGHTYHHGYS